MRSGTIRGRKLPVYGSRGKQTPKEAAEDKLFFDATMRGYLDFLEGRVAPLEDTLDAVEPNFKPRKGKS